MDAGLIIFFINHVILCSITHCNRCFAMLINLLMIVCFYLADGNHYLIETSDNSEEAGSVSGVDYAEPGCVKLTTDFAISCVNDGSVHKFSFLFDTDFIYISREVDQPNCSEREIKGLELREVHCLKSNLV